VKCFDNSNFLTFGSTVRRSRQQWSTSFRFGGSLARAHFWMPTFEHTACCIQLSAT